MAGSAILKMEKNCNKLHNRMTVSTKSGKILQLGTPKPPQLKSRYLKYRLSNCDEIRQEDAPWPSRTRRANIL